MCCPEAGLEGMERFLCIAGCARGQAFLRACAELGVKPTLLTLDSLQDAAWPREALEDLATMPSGLSRGQILNTVSWMARGRLFHRVVALDEGDLLTAAALREHMRIPGMGLTTAGYYCDRLAMWISARESGFAVPRFCRVLNYDELREFMERVQAPWRLIPRVSGPEQPERLIGDPEQLWRVLEQLGDLQSHFLLEEALEGERFTVESIVSESRVVFSVVHRHACLQAGGARLIETVDRSSLGWMELTALNGGLAPSLGMVRGVTQVRFLRSHADGRYVFNGISAGVGCNGTDMATEAATELSLWKEWARLEVAHLRGQDYVPAEWFGRYALCLQGMEPQLQADDPALAGVEVAFREQSGGQAALVLRSAFHEKLARLPDALANQR